MLIDEDDFVRATNQSQAASGALKNYVACLGTFVGFLTLAKNEPIRSSHLDLK
jgi:hypothetical protein